jgi:hypothetical protein
MEVVTPRVLYVDPLGYETTKEIAEDYAQRIINVELDPNSSRFEMCEENM